MEANRASRLWEWISRPLHVLLLLATATPFVWLVVDVVSRTTNFPTAESSRSVGVALATVDGTLRWQQLLQPDFGHITFFSHLLTAIVAFITPWNYNVEVYFNIFLAVVMFVLLLILAYRTRPQATLLAAFPMAVMAFSVRQEINLLVAYASSWYFCVIFMLLTVLVLDVWRNLFGVVVAGLMAICSSISIGGGVAAWAVGFVYLFLVRDVLWRYALYLILWIGGAGLTLWLYVVFDVFGNSNEGIDTLNLDVPRLLVLGRHNLYFVGSIFDGTLTLWGAGVMATLGTVIFVWNTVHTYRDKRDPRLISIWFSLGVGAYVIAFLVGLTRHTGGPIQSAYIFGRGGYYTTPMMLFWAAVAMSMVCVLDYHLRGNSYTGRGRGIVAANVGFAVLMIAMHIPSAVAFRTTNIYDERCLERMIFEQAFIDGCAAMPAEFVPLTLYNMIAERQLTVYAQRQPEMILGNEDGLPVLVEMPTAWLNIHTYNFFLAGVNADSLLHIYPPDTLDPVSMRNPPQLALTDWTEPAVELFAGELMASEAFWYVRPVDHDSLLPTLWTTLAENDYFILDTRPRGEGLLVSRVAAVPETSENSPVFGGLLRLRAVTDVNEVVAQCDALTLQSLWTREVEIPADYSASIKLINADGEQVAQSDAQLGTVSTTSWIEGEFYADQRSLTVPCDAPPGDYTLVLAVYFYQAPNDLLPVEGVTVGEFGDLALIRNVTVR
jgi:hypothetical protein